MVKEKNTNTQANTLATFSHALSQTFNMMNDACNINVNILCFRCPISSIHFAK